MSAAEDRFAAGKLLIVFFDLILLRGSILALSLWSYRAVPYHSWSDTSELDTKLESAKRAKLDRIFFLFLESKTQDRISVVVNHLPDFLSVLEATKPRRECCKEKKELLNADDVCGNCKQR